MYAGFQNVKGDFVAVMDADLQDPPQLLPEMLEIIKSGEYDSVAARRAGRKGEPVLRSAFCVSTRFLLDHEPYFRYRHRARFPAYEKRNGRCRCGNGRI